MIACINSAAVGSQAHQVETRPKGRSRKYATKDNVTGQWQLQQAIHCPYRGKDCKPYFAAEQDDDAGGNQQVIKGGRLLTFNHLKVSCLSTVI